MPQPDQINNVCVAGAGYMGNQIAVQSAISARSVLVYDTSEDAVLRCGSVQSRLLDEQIEAGIVAADQRRAILSRIRATTSLSAAVQAADLVIEAIREDLTAKRDLFRRLHDLCPADAILTTNSSSIRISRIESATGRPDKVLNTHFVQPIWKHPFVELMRGSATSDLSLSQVRGFMVSIGMTPILVRRENTGFVFNCIWRAVKKESLRLVDQGITTVEDVDRAWMIKMESPAGPFAMMDQVGLDVVRDIELVYHEESGDPSDEPPRLLLDKIANGELGVKSGRGFYTYPDPSWQSPDFLKRSRHSRPASGARPETSDPS